MNKIFKVLNKVALVCILIVILIDMSKIYDSNDYFVLLKFTILLIIHCIMFVLMISAEKKIDN